MDDEQEKDELNYHVNAAEIMCKPRDPLVVLNELLQLKREAASKKFLYRQLILVDEFLVTYPNSYYLVDLLPIMELLERLVEDLPHVPQYRIPLQLLFERAENLPLLRRASEMLKYGHILNEYFNLWSYFLLEIENDYVQYQVGKILLSILRAVSSTETHTTNAVTRSMIAHAIEKSYLPAVISELLPDVDEEFYTLLLKVSIELSQLSPIICEMMLDHRAAPSIVLRLDPEFRSRSLTEQVETELVPTTTIKNLNDTATLLWHLTERLRNNRSDFPQLTQKEWTCFRYAMAMLVADQRTKLERNFIMASILKTFAYFPSINFYSTRLPEDFCRLCTSLDFEVGDNWKTNMRHSKEVLDYDFKKMMLLGLGYLAQLGSTEPIRRCEVIRTLIRVINPETNTQWQSVQYCKMLHLTLCVSIKVMPLLVDEFIRFDGPKKLMDTLNYYYAQHQYDYDILTTVLRLVWTLIRTKDEAVAEQFQENGVVTSLTNIGKLLLRHRNMSTSKQNCLIFSFLITELFVKRNEDCEQIDFLQFTLNYLRRIGNQQCDQDDGVLDVKVVISCISCLWECVKANAKNFEYFVSNNGVYLLLDIIEKSTEAIQIVGLGMLVDLCEDESTVPYVLTWRKNGKRYINLLMEIVRKENESLKVKVSKSGVLEDIYHPLMGEVQYRMTYDRDRQFIKSSPAIMDLYASARPKVYAVVQLLRRHQEVVTIVDECYKIQMDELPVQDEVTLLLIENYLMLKLGEVWYEIAESIKAHGTQLIGIDDNLITTLRMRMPVVAQHIQTAQLALIQEKYQKETTKEKRLYEKLKDVRLGESLKAMSEVHYIARTTESLFRMIQKMRQRTYVDNSNLPVSSTAEHHNTFQYSINVNPVFKQQITMHDRRSDKKMIHTIKEVSPPNSTENLLNIEEYDDDDEDWSKLE